MWWPFPAFTGAALALIAERFIGYPKPVYEKISHPVVWIGWLIAWLDRKLNRGGADAKEGRLRGIIALLALISVALIPAWIVSQFLATTRVGWIVEALIATSLIAQKSMRDHVMDVYRAFGKSLPAARHAVGMIVGRDPSQLDESGVSKAALESLAENTSDGIVAPIFWFALLGLPGIAIYKAVNTADSMIGHKSEKYLHFGWASARFDDLINLPASRLTGILFAATQPSRFRYIFDVMMRDAPKHGSPNAGWPEAAMAAALDVKFGGPRAYQGERVDLPWMGEGREHLTRQDIKRGLKTYSRAMWLLFLGMVFLAITL
jgi:adenosylcobinamide-phosphate synthase